MDLRNGLVYQSRSVQDASEDLVIAGLRFRLGDCDPKSRADVRDRLPEFHAPRAGEPDITLSLQHVTELPHPSLVGEDVVIDRPGGNVVAFRRSDFDAAWDPAKRLARCRYGGEIGALYSFLRVVCSFALLGRGGALFHASSIVSRGRAFVFAGPSGTGKTTIARLGAPRPVLSDEVTALVPAPGGGYVCHPTPFWGDMVRVRAGSAAPLAAIGFPIHGPGPEPALRPASRSDTFARLMECAIAFDLTRGEKDALLDVVKAIASSAVCLHVEYALDHPPWELLDALVPST